MNGEPKSYEDVEAQDALGPSPPTIHCLHFLSCVMIQGHAADTKLILMELIGGLPLEMVRVHLFLKPV